MRHIPAIDPEHCARSNAAELRRAFVVPDLFQPGKVVLNAWETDRTIVGGIVPLAEECRLPSPPELAAGFFAERREAGIINIGAAGSVTVDGRRHPVGPLDGFYLGRGSREVSLASADPQAPAQFYLLSYPAHASHPSAAIARSAITPVELGSPEKANCRSLYKYIHPGAVASCQLVMGLTLMKNGSLWNTMPPHTHPRRSEVYLYFDLSKDDVVFHFAGLPRETRSLVIRDREAVVSPSWSIHCGVGTARYGFIWGMGGENQDFADMDAVPISLLS